MNRANLMYPILPLHQTTAMNKLQLVKEVAGRAKVPVKTAKAVVDATLQVIKGALQKGDRVQLVGFGSFFVRQTKARTVRNPQTKKPMQVPAKKVIRFKASAALGKGLK